MTTAVPSNDPYTDLDARQRAELDRRCDHHPPAGVDTAVRHARWRESVKTLMAVALTVMQPGREASLVLTALDEALMWGNAAISRPPSPGGRPAGQ